MSPTLGNDEGPSTEKDSRLFTAGLTVWLLLVNVVFFLIRVAGSETGRRFIVRLLGRTAS